jgi:hypothetical protein
MLQMYCDVVLEDLLARFEAPRQADRWDSPLFTVNPSIEPSNLPDQLVPILAFLRPSNIHDATCTQGDRKPSTHEPHALRPTIATIQPAPQDAGWLQQIDGTAQAVLQRLVDAQSDVGPGLAIGRIEVCKDFVASSVLHSCVFVTRLSNRVLVSWSHQLLLAHLLGKTVVAKLLCTCCFMHGMLFPNALSFHSYAS